MRTSTPEGQGRFRSRAARSHRSLQGELMVILEEAVYGGGTMTPDQLLDYVRDLGLSTSATAAETIRAERDAR